MDGIFIANHDIMTSWTHMVNLLRDYLHNSFRKRKNLAWSESNGLKSRTHFSTNLNSTKRSYIVEKLYGNSYYSY